ncbi:hypothetical protein TSAR_008959 [Trichomalopsis sarcophagae]|uniref:Uncharacterized protein n=1 Tax=Trichomalopsis sarcophagae TaxID=543379 RepID=A0A232EDF2_9HYME|nr:hypothetical protein TSAR_008959 [Trichomalopsis sarcophagae]
MAKRTWSNSKNHTRGHKVPTKPNRKLRNLFRLSYHDKTISERKYYKRSNLQIDLNQTPEIKEVKILGLIFDSRLTWKPHIEHLKRQCIFRSNILKTLSARNWGASQQILYMEQLKIISLKPWTQFSTPAYEYLQEHLELAQ